MRDAVLLNAAGALVAFDGIGAGRSGRWPTPSRRPLERAAAAVDSGAARDAAGALGGALHAAGGVRVADAHRVLPTPTARDVREPGAGA